MLWDIFWSCFNFLLLQIIFTLRFLLRPFVILKALKFSFLKFLALRYIFFLTKKTFQMSFIVHFVFSECSMGCLHLRVSNSEQLRSQLQQNKLFLHFTARLLFIGFPIPARAQNWRYYLAILSPIWCKSKFVNTKWN